MKKLISLLLMLIAFVAFTSTAWATEKPPGTYIQYECCIIPVDSQAAKTQSTSAGGLPYLCKPIAKCKSYNSQNTYNLCSAGGLIRLC